MAYKLSFFCFLFEFLDSFFFALKNLFLLTVEGWTMLVRLLVIASFGLLVGNFSE
jgi:hypothetical protein